MKDLARALQDSDCERKTIEQKYEGLLDSYKSSQTKYKEGKAFMNCMLPDELFRRIASLRDSLDIA